MQYSPTIQILRGVSVLWVIFFHFHIPGFENGFLGVDIFFVISGYLMAKLYDSSQKFNFFYKRAIRLLPVYFATIILTLFVSGFLLSLREFKLVFSQAIFASLFSSNIGYWLENTYFNQTSFKPLLHLWSLGVEIQFYLCIPLFFWFFRKSKIFYYLIFLASFILSLWMVTISPKTSFFWMPLRLWEFLVGFGIALYFSLPSIKNNPSTRQKMSMMSLGGLIVVIGFLFVDIYPESQSFINSHPSLMTFF